MPSFIYSIEECLGAKLTCKMWTEVGIPDTPEWMLCKDGVHNNVTSKLDEAIAHEAYNECISAFTMLPMEKDDAWYCCGMPAQ